MIASLSVYGCDQPSCSHLVILQGFNMRGRSFNSASSAKSAASATIFLLAKL